MREINLKTNDMKLSYFNHTNLSKELLKNEDVTPTTKRMLETVFFWALQHNDTKNTVCVDGRSAKVLYKLEELGFIKVTHIRWNRIGAELVGEWELDTRWENK